MQFQNIEINCNQLLLGLPAGVGAAHAAEDADGAGYAAGADGAAFAAALGAAAVIHVAATTLRLLTVTAGSGTFVACLVHLKTTVLYATVTFGLSDSALSSSTS